MDSDPNNDLPPTGDNSAAALASWTALMIHHNNRVTQGARLVLEDVAAEGRAGIEAKKLVGHGGWDTHLETHAQQCKSTIAGRMRIARAIDSGKLKYAELADLSVNQILKRISQTKVVDPVAHEKRKITKKLNAIKGKPNTAAEERRLQAALAALDAGIADGEIVLERGLAQTELPSAPASGEVLYITNTADYAGRQGVYMAG